MSNKLLVVIAGPTAVGKTEVAINLALHYQTEILSADSRQVYQEMNVGVGRPSQEQLNKVPHHFIGHRSIHAPYTAAMYAREALTLLEKLFEQHNIVILTGGTGLYIKALSEGFDDIPDVPVAIFNKWQKIWEKEGIESLLVKLREVDPVYLETVDQSNHTRLIRALSVAEATNSPMSSFLKGEKANLPFKVLNIALELPREELYEKIDKKVLHMMEAGWLEEANTLYPYRDLQALQTVGYKELFAHFDENIPIEQTIAAIQQATRRYAKRQLTWWRNQGAWINMAPNNTAELIQLIDSCQQTN